jgi:formylmethanofuran dehydrogenase subunit E
MGLFAGELLGIVVPQEKKQLLTIVETDGCAADGIAVATNCWVGRRTMRVEDYGKVAATFVDTASARAIRIVPRPEARARAAEAAPEETGKWRRQLIGYQRVPASDLFDVREVELKTPVAHIVSRAGVKALCRACGEEILNEREVTTPEGPVCRACAGEGYYTVKG